MCLNSCAMKAEKNIEQAPTTTLVVYFSATGTTERAAQKLAKAAKADLYKIQPQEIYTSSDLDWTNKKSRSSVENDHANIRPAIATKVADFNKYNIIYVGFPIWWDKAPNIVMTFLDSYNFNGKKVIPFATSSGSGVTKASEDLMKKYPNIKWGKGMLLNSIDNDELTEWINSNI